MQYEHLCLEKFNHAVVVVDISSLFTGLHPALFILNPVTGVLRAISTLNSHK
jgi:hypothetical protein